jgi:glycosyltransferase involved in cell wall biosynthesis
MKKNLLPSFEDKPSANWPWASAPPADPSEMPGGKPWPKITIVTPSYNQGQYLEETIRSVLLQDYPNLEYIVIDGGSTDISVEIIRKYESYLTYWESRPDRGQSHAINKGFAQATGQIMGWINSDDGLLPGALRTVALTMNESELMVAGGCLVANAFNDPEGKYSLKKPDWRKMLYQGNTLWQPGVFWKRSLWEKAGPLREELHYIMDHDLFLRMQFHLDKVKFIDVPLALARVQPEQKTRPENLRQIAAEKEKVALENARRAGTPRMVWFLKSWYIRSRKNFPASGRLADLFPSRALWSALFNT